MEGALLDPGRAERLARPGRHLDRLSVLVGDAHLGRDLAGRGHDHDAEPGKRPGRLTEAVSIRLR